MDDPKRHVVEDYPAERLPDELRGEIDPSATVTVSVSVQASPQPTFREIFDALREARVSSDDPVLGVRALREEWEERERFLDSIERGGSE